ncbi:Regulatory protein RecX [Halioglobus japonicus]|nr:Regulatory protein RecX [Halioglobus japonicus]
MTDEMETVEAVINPADIRLAAMNLLARREHSIWELRRKLKRRFTDESLLDEQLSRLTEQNLQSDLRFAESYVRQRINRGYGPVRLCEELRERGITKSDIALTMEELEIDWYSHAAQVLKNKFGEQAPADIKEEARRARFMQHRGFTAEHYRYPHRD